MSVDVIANETNIDNPQYDELKESYTNLLLKLIESNNLREMEYKERIAHLEEERLRINNERESYFGLEKAFVESQASIEQLSQNEEKLISEWRKLNRETLEAKAKYDALVILTEHKLNESNNEIQRLSELFQNETATLKAKIVRLETSNQTMQQSLISKEKEVSRLRHEFEGLLQKIQ